MLKILKVLIGISLIIGGGIVEIMWLGVCFGTVVLGIALLIFAPHVLFLPWNIAFLAGVAFIASAEE